MQRRLELFVALPVEKLDRLKLERLVMEIGSELDPGISSNV
jgi:hypothetical protein